MDNNSISILLATYNGEKYLEDQFDSIINQSFKHWKLYIRDDGSNDRTSEIIHKYIKDFPQKIELIKDNKKNLGSIGNFSELLQHTESDYIMFCDQDDVWMPDKIELSLKKILELEDHYGSETPLLVFSDLYVVDENLNIISYSFWKKKKRNPDNTTLSRLIIQNVITGCTVIINKKLACLSIPIPENAMMHDWWISLVASAFGKIEYIDRQLIYYRQHGNNIVGANTKSVLMFIDKVISGKFDKNIFLDHMRRVFTQAELFLERYRDQLDHDSYIIMKNFISLRKIGFWKRKIRLNKYKFYCNSLIDNLELFFRL